MAELKPDVKPKELVSIDKTVELYAPQLQKALPKGMMIDRFVKIIANVIRYNPVIASCSQDSIFAAIVQSVQLGLEPNVLGHCYFVPYKNNQTQRMEVQFQIGYRGLLELAYRSGQIESIEAIAIHTKDHFKLFRTADGDDFQYQKSLDADAGAPIGYLGIAKFKTGSTRFELMSVFEINRIKELSKAKGEYSPWAKHYGEMAKKTVLKRLCKTLPLSTDVKIMMAADETTKLEISPDMAQVPDKTDWDSMPAPALVSGEAQAPAEPIKVSTAKLEDKMASLASRLD